jgi:glycosyltransferase involved in cell wall biosynthesis
MNNMTISKKSIFFIADVRNWAFDNIAQYLKSILEDSYDVKILYAGDFNSPGELIDELNLCDHIDYVHFFYRGYLQELLEYIAVNQFDAESLRKFLSAGTTTSIPDHLFIRNTEDILHYQPSFLYVDHYYTISQKLFEIYSDISFYPKPWKAVIFDNILIEKQKPNLDSKKKLVVAWVGNSAWGEHYFDKLEDPKGYNTVILPTFAALEEEQIDVEKCIIDGNQKKRSKKEIFEILGKADILLISANTDGTPLPLIEAMSVGCAVITTDNGIAPEVLPDDQQQFIVNKNPEEFVDAIKVLNSDRQLLKKLKQQNIAAHKKIFCNNKNFRKLWSSLIEDTISRARKEGRLTKKKDIISGLQEKHMLQQKRQQEQQQKLDKGSLFSMKRIIVNNTTKRIVKYFLKYNFLHNFVNIPYKIIYRNRIKENLYSFISTLAAHVTSKGDDIYTLCTNVSPVIMNSTISLFDKTIVVPSNILLEQVGLPNTIIDQMAQAILDQPIRKLVISGENKVLFQLIERLNEKKGKKILDIYCLWHGSSSEWLNDEGRHLVHFNKIYELYKQHKIQGVVALKKDLDIVLDAFGIRSYLLQNLVEKQTGAIRSQVVQNKFNIGMWVDSMTPEKNLYPQLLAISLLNKKIALHTNFNFSIHDNWLQEKIEMKIYSKESSIDELMQAKSNTDIAMHITHHECSPVVALESLSLGIPCLVGPSSGLYDGDKFLEGLLTVNRVDCSVAISKAIQKVMDNYDAIKVKLPEFIKMYNQNANQLKQKFLNDIVIEEERVFSEIYDTNFWTNGSGPGSHKDNTVEYRKLLQKFFDDPLYNSYVDIGCGDWQIMELINIPENKVYHGYDIVQSVIDANNSRFQKKNIKFQQNADIDAIKAADLLIIKDVMMHWTNERVAYFLDNILPKFKYALLTEGFNEDNKKFNTEINFGQFRNIDITQSPFNCKNVKQILEYRINNWSKRVYLYERDAD